MPVDVPCSKIAAAAEFQGYTSQKRPIFAHFPWLWAHVSVKTARVALELEHLKAAPPKKLEMRPDEANGPSSKEGMYRCRLLPKVCVQHQYLR